MNWKLKAGLQKLAARLPGGCGEAVRDLLCPRPNQSDLPGPIAQLQLGARVVDYLRRVGYGTAGEAVVQVGPGRRLGLPLALWLCGAERIVAVDRERRLNPELVAADLAWLRTRPEDCAALFTGIAPPGIFAARFERLLSAPTDIAALLALLNLEYLAPVDAVALPLAATDFDYHLSAGVLEHVPLASLAAILREGRRVLRADGRVVHFLDLSDHFSHSDRGITSVNFLRFSEGEWQSWAGNRFTYQNRVRPDELVEMLQAAGLKVEIFDRELDGPSLEALREDRLPLADRFRDKPPEINATKSVWLVAAPETSQP